MTKALLALVTVLIVGMFLVGCSVPQEVQQELSQLQAENSQLNTEKTQWQAEKAELEKKVADLEGQVAELTEKALKDPTYEEAVAFIKEDKTNEDFKRDHSLAAMLVTENARKQGINSYWVVAQTPAQLGGIGFHFVGFNTTDRGWVYFCTTSICADSESKIEVGKRLHKSNPSWNDPGFDDTVLSIHHLPF